MPRFEIYGEVFNKPIILLSVVLWICGNVSFHKGFSVLFPAVLYEGLYFVQVGDSENCSCNLNFAFPSSLFIYFHDNSKIYLVDLLTVHSLLIVILLLSNLCWFDFCTTKRILMFVTLIVSTKSSWHRSVWKPFVIKSQCAHKKLWSLDDTKFGFKHYVSILLLS